MNQSLPGITQLHTDLAERIRDGSFEALLILDIDQFHQLNAAYGHKTGDRVLALVEGVVMEGSWDGTGSEGTSSPSSGRRHRSTTAKSGPLSPSCPRGARGSG